MSIKTYGPFRINGRDGQFCSIFVNRWDGVMVTAPASDRVQLGGWTAGEVGPDGRPEPAGDGFPAPALNRYSLIFRIGTGRWQPGHSEGPLARTEIADVDGQVILHINDDLLTDNTGGWSVTVTRTAFRDITDLPRPGSSALFQSVDGKMRLIATQNRITGGTQNNLPGNLGGYQRDRSFNWTTTPLLTNLLHTGLDFDRANAYLYPSWFQATDGRFWGVCVQGTQVKYFVHGARPADVPRADDCVGAPAMIQSNYGNRGHFELAYPTRDGIKFRFANNNSRSCDWSAPLAWDDGVATFGNAGVQSVRLLQSSKGNLEVIALGRTGAGVMQLRHWRRDDGRTWQWNPPVELAPNGLLPGSELVVPSSIPAFIQSSFRPGGGPDGNYEVLAPSQEGGLLHWHYVFMGAGAGWHSDRPINHRGPQVSAVHMIQSDFGAHQNNFEVVAETGEPRSSRGAGVGFGSLLFYWCNNDAATNSDGGIWGGPFTLPYY